MMKRSLISQMKNEWRDNTGMVIGLTVLCLAIWYFCSSLFTTVKYHDVPLGFDETDVMRFNVNRLGADSPEFIAPEDGSDASYDDDLRALLKRVRDSQYVEYAGFSINAVPYSSGYRGGDTHVLSGADTMIYKGNRRMISPDVVMVLRLESRNGKTAELLRDVLTPARY